MQILRASLAVLFLAAAGCGGHGHPAQPAVSTAECAAAAQNDARLLTESATGAPAAAGADLGAALERHCRDDGWSEDAQACIATARDMPAMGACDPLLTDAQKDGIARESGALASTSTGGATFGGATYGAPGAN